MMIAPMIGYESIYFFLPLKLIHIYISNRYAQLCSYLWQKICHAYFII